MGLVLNIIVLVLGLGGTLVSVLALPKTKLRTFLIYFFSLVGFAGLLLTFFTQADAPFTFSDALTCARSVAGAIWRWSIAQLPLLERLWPLWLVIGVVIGIAAQRWLFPRWRKVQAAVLPSLQTDVWLTPKDAVEKFVDAQLIAKWRTSQAKVRELDRKIAEVKAELELSQSGDRNGVLGNQLMYLEEEHSAAAELTEHRSVDVMSSLYDQIKSKRLIAKGRKVTKDGKVSGAETLMPDGWGIRYKGREILDIESRVFSNMVGTFHDVQIGKRV